MRRWLPPLIGAQLMAFAGCGTSQSGAPAEPDPVATDPAGWRREMAALAVATADPTTGR